MRKEKGATIFEDRGAIRLKMWASNGEKAFGRIFTIAYKKEKK